MRVREIMSEPVETVAPSMGVDEAATFMRGRRLRHLIVKDAGKVVGVLSKSDIREPVPLPGTNLTVSDVMSLNVVTIDENETVRRAANLMRGRAIGCLAVMHDGKLTGIVTISDLLALLGGGVDRRKSGPRASLHYRTRHGKQRSGARW